MDLGFCQGGLKKALALNAAAAERDCGDEGREEDHRDRLSAGVAAEERAPRRRAGRLRLGLQGRGLQKSACDPGWGWGRGVST